MKSKRQKQEEQEDQEDQSEWGRKITLPYDARKELLEKLKNSGIPLCRLSRGVDMSPSALSRILSGKRKISVRETFDIDSILLHTECVSYLFREYGKYLIDSDRERIDKRALSFEQEPPKEPNYTFNANLSCLRKRGFDRPPRPREVFGLLRDVWEQYEHCSRWHGERKKNESWRKAWNIPESSYGNSECLLPLPNRDFKLGDVLAE